MAQKTSMKVSCSGGTDSESKHPLIYLSIDSQSEKKCPYCSKIFAIKKMKNNSKNYIEASEAVSTKV
jgi:uncharacterized Zn-finger protein